MTNLKEHDMIDRTKRYAARIGAFPVLGVFIALSWTTRAETGPVVTEFAGFIHFCSGGPPDKFFVTPNGETVHVRGASNQNVWETGNPLIDGAETNQANININPSGGNVQLDVTVYPDGVLGTWEISQTLHPDDTGTLVGKGVGHGTGELHGMTIKFTAGAIVLTGANPCGPFPSAPISGEIRQ